MRTATSSLNSPRAEENPVFDTVSVSGAVRATPRMKPRVLTVDTSLVECQLAPPLFEGAASCPHLSKSLCTGRSGISDDYGDGKFDIRRPAPVITLDFVDGLISTLRRLEPNYIIPQVDSDERSLQLFVAQLCSSLLHWIAQLKTLQHRHDGGLDFDNESRRRSLTAKEQHLAEVAQRLIDERKDLDLERRQLDAERRELEEVKNECLTDREVLRGHMKEVERQTAMLEKDMALRKNEEKSEDMKRTAMIAKLQQSLRQQQAAMKRQFEELEQAKARKESELSDLEDKIQEKQSLLAQMHTELCQLESSKAHNSGITDSLKTLYIDSLQTQLELDKTRYRIQSDQSQLEQQRAELMTEELKFNDAFTRRIARLGKLGEELELRNQELARARDRFDMARADLESQIQSLKTLLAESGRDKDALRERNERLQTQIADLQDEIRSERLHEKLRVVSASQAHAELEAREQEVIHREAELETRLIAAVRREESLKKKIEDLGGLEDSLKAAQEALLLMKKESAASGQQLAQKQAKLNSSQTALEQERAAFLLHCETVKKEIEAEHRQLLENKAELEKTTAIAQTLSRELQEAKAKIRAEEEAVQRDKDRVKELVDLIEREGAKLSHKEEQLRQFSKQLNDREQQLYDREKGVRRKEFRLSDHKAEREALKLRTPCEEGDLFDPDEMLSCTLSPSPGEPHSLERTPL